MISSVARVEKAPKGKRLSKSLKKDCQWTARATLRAKLGVWKFKIRNPITITAEILIEPRPSRDIDS